MTRIFAAIAILVAATFSVQADEPNRWSGPYLGVHAGYGWSAFDGSMIYTDATDGDGFDADAKTIDAEGGIAGGQVGFNFQNGSIVWGIEADASWSDISGDATFLPYPVNYPANGSPAWAFETSIDWLATVRGRLGIAADRTLIYGTGGIAWAGAETSLDVVGPGYDAWGRKSETLTGWTVGGGLEHALSRQWTIRAEYLYYRFDDVGGILPGMQMTSCNPACPHETDGFGGDIDLHTVRVGVNYQFN